MAFHIPAHKNVDHPAGQYREPHPSRQVDEASKNVPTTQREVKPRACPVYRDPYDDTQHGTCFARVLKLRISQRSQS